MTSSNSVTPSAQMSARPSTSKADSICSGNPPDEVIRAVESSQVRDRLLDMLAEMERAGDQTDAKRLDNLLKKHAQTVALERKQRPSPPVPKD